MKKRRASLDINNLSITSSHHRASPSSSPSSPSSSSNHTSNPNKNSQQQTEDDDDYVQPTTTSRSTISKPNRKLMKNAKSKRKKEMVLNICPPSSLGHDSLGDDEDMDENGNFHESSQPRSALLPSSIDYFAEDEENSDRSLPSLSLPDDAENIIEREKALTLSDIQDIENQYQGGTFFYGLFQKHSFQMPSDIESIWGYLETVDIIFYFKSLPYLREISFANNKIKELVHGDYLNDSTRVKELEKILPKSLIEIDLSWNYISQFPSLELITLLQKKGIKFDIRFNCISELPKEFLYEADEALSDSEYSKPKSKTTSKFVALNHNTLFDLRNTIPSKILDNLYVGSMSSARNVHLLCDVLNVRYVLNVSSFVMEPEQGFKGKKYEEFFDRVLNLEVLDDSHQDIIAILDDCFQFIDEARKEKQVPVIVHCVAGQSRSVSIVIAYVMRELNLNFQQAFDYVKECHTFSQPNVNFQMQLSCFKPQKQQGEK
ncbi:hypothetical protein C9374_011000 [Naegleria lovaniensis]|uniref:protein-tyrosine-phosphatase n=1 Tax=Naegleria lovaniensis TaxID=51637 RepID=A0AA88KDI5_NAELO|nr:uncharacterized protein C9374_011000 [Naegleria lovaniensis]KAG2374163.1 hypothetical protein C9374_011000 [Naegleria lovaniensis]